MSWGALDTSPCAWTMTTSENNPGDVYPESEEFNLGSTGTSISGSTLIHSNLFHPFSSKLCLFDAISASSPVGCKMVKRFSSSSWLMTIYYSTSDCRLYKSTDGVSWTRLGSSSYNYAFDSYLRGDGQALLMSASGVLSAVNLSTGANTTVIASGASNNGAFVEGNGSVIFAGTGATGIHVSTDGGASFSPVTIASSTTVISVAFKSDTNTFYACVKTTSNNDGAIYTSSTGASWSLLVSKTQTNTFVASTSIIAGDMSIGYADSSYIILPTYIGAWVSSDSGSTFTYKSSSFSSGQPRKPFVVGTISSGGFVFNIIASGTTNASAMYFYSFASGMGSLVAAGTVGSGVSAPWCNTTTTSPHIIDMGDGTYRYYYPSSGRPPTAAPTNSQTIYYATIKPTKEDTWTMPTTLAFEPTSPAKLASLGDLVVTLAAQSTTYDGTTKLYMQHYNDEIAAWSSCADVAGAWTEVGTCSTYGGTNTFSAPAMTMRAGEKVRFKFGFSSATGLKPASSITAFSIVWSSDVTAPGDPTITLFSSAAPVDGFVGYRADFGSLPSGSRHLIVEAKKNGSSYLPFSNRAKIEADNGYMRFRGDISAVEAAGERNEQHFSFAKGLSLGDVVQIKVAAEDDVGNRSAFVESSEVTIAAPSGGEVQILVPVSQNVPTTVDHNIATAGSIEFSYNTVNVPVASIVNVDVEHQILVPTSQNVPTTVDHNIATASGIEFSYNTVNVPVASPVNVTQPVLVPQAQNIPTDVPYPVDTVTMVGSDTEIPVAVPENIIFYSLTDGYDISVIQTNAINVEVKA